VQYIRRKTHKPIALKFWVEGDVKVSLSILSIATLIKMTSEKPMRLLFEKWMGL